MARWRAAVGLFVGGFLVLSGVAHSFLAGPAIKSELSKANTPSDLASSLLVGWVLGGAAMFTFGGIVISECLRGLRRGSVALGPLRWIAFGYSAYGVWAFAATGMEPFFLVMFTTPGVLLAVACGGSPARA